MNNPDSTSRVWAETGAILRRFSVARIVGRLTLPVVVLVMAALLAQHAQAQYIHFRSPQTRITVSVGSTNSTVITNNVLLNTIDSNGAALSVNGLPAGASAVLSTNVAPANNTPLQITVNTENVAEGTYTFSVDGSGMDTNGLPVQGTLLYTLQVAYLWNGGTNAITNGATALTDATQWLSNSAPGANDDLVFPDAGGQFANATNITISGNVTNASARFATTNATRFYTIQINPGSSWTLTGTNGFSILRDYVDNFAGIGQAPTIGITGAGGTLVVSNEQALFNSMIDNGVQYTTDLSGLDNFNADIKELSLGDFRTYPNFFNIDANNTSAAGVPGGIPRQFLCSINFAKTNVVRAVLADPFNYTNSDSRDYSFSFNNSELSGSSTAPTVNFGISNLFMLDSLNFVGGNGRGTVRFNPNFVSNSPSAYFRGTNGGRMSVFSVSDGGGTNTANSNIKSTIDFSGGTLDVLCDRFYIGRDRAKIVAAGTPNYQGFFTMANGIVDANTVVLGFREHVPTNSGYAFNGYCEGRVFVLSNGVFKANQTLTLGYTVETDPNGLGSAGNTEWGQVTVQNGGSLVANTILVGGPVYGASKNNNIIISNNASMIISNTVGGPQQSLDNLTFINNSTLVMNIDGTNPGPYIYATNLNTTGTNTLQIASIKNIGSITGTIQLIQYTGGGGAFQNLIMPSGVGGALITTNNQGVYLTILQGTPKRIVWRGYDSANWDLSSFNWLDIDTGLHTNFANGDFVNFDDDVSSPTTVHLAGGTDIIPGSIGMTNDFNSYVIDSQDATAMKGSATLSKSGTNGVEIDAVTSVSVELDNGTLTGFGAIGSASVASNTVMTYSGNVSGGINCSGVATLSGTGSGTLAIQATGIVTNNGSYNGAISMVSGALLVNLGSIGGNGNALAVGDPVIPLGATFINGGDIHSATLTVNGTMEDLGGAGSINIYGNNSGGGMTIGSGGTFIPGGDGIGTTMIVPENGTPITNHVGRLLLSVDSTNIFKIDPTSGSPQNTMADTFIMGWGPNSSTPNNGGGTIVISNTTGAPFIAGQKFTLVANSVLPGSPALDAGLNTTNTFPVIVPATPGPGLAWDLSGIIHQGVLGVLSVPTTPTNVGLHVTFGSTVVTNSGGTPTGTNFFRVSELNWPSSYIGWELQAQTTPLNVGLTPTNWVTVAGSRFTNDVFVTNNVTAGGFYFRMVYP